MIFSNKSSPKSTRHAAFLYAVVFNSAVSTFVIFALFLSFLVQPLHQAYAQEAENAAAAAAEAPPEPAPEVVEEVPSEPEVVEEEDEIVEETAEEESQVVPATDENEPVTDTVAVSKSSSSAPAASATSTPVARSSSTPVSTTASTSPQSTGVSTPSVPSTTAPTASSSESVSGSGGAGSNSDDEPIVDSTDTGTEDTTDDSPASNVGSPSSGGGSDPSNRNDDAEESETQTENDTTNDAVDEDERPERVKEVEYLVTEQNYYQFSKQSCVAVGDGAYHCSANESSVLDQQSVVYSEVGENGNLEIFIRTSRGTVEQITDNQYDDSAPHYDPESMRIAWQRQIDGRYQIILYDIRSQEETQLTFARTNSMEPAVSDAGVVWQSWDGNDWEIVFYDGTYTENLTNNDAQDVAPVLEDEYIIWTVIGGKSQTAQVYSILTKETTTIVNHEGGSIVNPRFVLVYDTQFENGDIVTQGFDPETGFSAPIAAQPAPDPIDIPESDSTGETRALIQNKSGKESLDVVNGDDTGPEPVPGPSVTSTSTSTEPVLDLKSATTSVSIAVDDGAVDIESEATTTSEFIELDEYDLIITPEHVERVMAEATSTEATPLSIVDAETASSSQSSQ